MRTNLFRGLLLSMALLFSVQTYADIVMSATHTAISSSETAEGFSSIIELTLSNAGTSSLSDVLLTPIDLPLFPAPEPDGNNLSVESIASGALITVQWTVSTMIPLEAFVMLPIILQGTGFDLDGTAVTFSLVSNQGDLQ